MRTTTSLESMKNSLAPGGVYRRSDFKEFTSNLDRNLVKLVEKNLLQKVQNALYFCPKKTPFGQALPDERELLSKFLNDDHFVVYGPSMFNSLGLGTTQLYDKKIVFNRKRHGEMKLGDRTYFFHRWREAPKSLSKEFLLVEMLNRLKELAEDHSMVMENVEKKLHEFSSKKLYNALNRFGTKSTQNKLKPLLEKRTNVST